MKKLILGLSLAGLVSVVHAEPYYAAWKGVSCNACHVNQTGGNLRNAYGKSFGDGLQTFDWKGFTEVTQSLEQKAPRYLSTGVDLHMGYQRDHDDSSFLMGRQSFYLQARLNDLVSAVVTYRPAGAKEVYGLVSNIPQGGFVKIGTFHLPYGLTLADDRSFTRAPLGFGFDRVENGMQVGIQPGFLKKRFFLTAAMVNGTGATTTDVDNQKTFDYWATYSLSPITIGGSCFRQYSKVFGFKKRYGVFGWARLWRFVALGEYDDGGVGPDDKTIVDHIKVSHASLECDLGYNVFLRATHEFLNPSIAVDDETNRYVGSLRCYPAQNLEVELAWEFLDAVVGGDQKSLLADTHFFF